MKWKVLAPNFLEKLIKANKPIYVLNTSRLPSGEKGVVLINFYEGNRREYFKIPPTFIPMAVSDAIPIDRILNSRDFKQTLVKGMLTLVDPDQAEEYLSSPEAQQEYEDLVLSEHSMKAKGIEIEAEMSKRMNVSHNASESYGPTQDLSATDTVSNKVRGLVEDLNSGLKPEKEVMQELRRHQEALKHIDLSYVMSNSSGDLHKWVKKVLAEMSQEERQEKPEPIKKKTATPTVKKVITEKPKAKTERSDKSFDFDDVKMTPEELAADARHKAQWASQQAVDGGSVIDQEINKMLSGNI
jgi:hypothetical protein